ncbi:MAG: hypothetical protein NZM06_10065 [Chloroherpetonaceae bacterium]|nr:hypothetical protein [Chloroherpetonaceae bacterium]MDW8437420.1 hypothetical protein [Chloroherpetonaceae bacterium]
MKSDTSPEIQRRYREMILARSPEERFRMGLDACALARKFALASLPPDLDETEKRVQLFLRYYKNDFSPEQREKIIAALRECGKRQAQSI